MSEKDDNKMPEETDCYDSISREGEMGDTWAAVISLLFIFILIVSSSKTCGIDNKASYEKYDYKSSTYNKWENSKSYQIPSNKKENQNKANYRSNTPVKYASTSGTASGSTGKKFRQTDDKDPISPSYLAGSNLVHAKTNRCLECKCENLPGPIGRKGAVGPTGPKGLPGIDGTLPIWELCFSLAGVLILLYFSKLAIDAYWKKWLIKTGKTTWIQFVKE